MPTNAVCKLHDLSAALPTIHELGILTGKMPVPLPTPDSRLGILTGKMPVPLPTPDSRLPTGNCNRQDACSTPDSRLPLTHIVKSLIVGWAVPTNAVCKLHDLSAALPTIHELGIVTGKMPVPLPTPDSRLPTPDSH
ncbi:hypothetical protein [Moorena producens]|uniref:hypothetical protein n=1 Tax=Moorena producens TaxID=1155739 RepID=UPI0011EA655C|nr:hypothetical protein [Moorena producens]